MKLRQAYTLLLLLLLAGIGCSPCLRGTECGNPSAQGVASPGCSTCREYSGQEFAPFVFTESAAATGFTAASQTFNERLERFSIDYPQDWLATQDQADEVAFNHPAGEQASSLTITVVDYTSQNPLETFASDTYPELTFVDFVTDTTSGIVASTADNSIEASTLIALIRGPEDTLLTVTIRRAFNDNGIIATNFMMHTLTVND